MVDQFLSRAHIIACECASDCQCNNEAEEEKIVSHGDSSRKKRQQSVTEKKRHNAKKKKNEFRVLFFQIVLPNGIFDN